MKNRLIQLLRDNAQAKARLPLQTIRASDAPAEATIYVYDVIVADEWEADYWGGVAPLAFIKTLQEAALSADVIHLRFNSPGGDVFAARAMEAAVRSCEKKVVAHIDGYAASAASYLAIAADEVEMAPGAFFMIHKAWTFAVGNSADMTAAAEVLEKIDSTLIDTYAKETGCDRKKVEDMMSAETWITAQEAVEMGFADRIAEDAVKASAAWNLNAYANAPKAAADDPQDAPAPEVEPGSPVVEEQVPHGEPAPCTTEETVGLNQTDAVESGAEKYLRSLNHRRV